MWFKYPYTNYSELNLDWFLSQFKELTEAWDAQKVDYEQFKLDVTTEFNTLSGKFDNLKDAFDDLYDYVHDYFENLDVQQEINNKLDELVSDGTMTALIQPLFDTYEQTVNQRMTSQDDAIDVLEGRMDAFSTLAEGSTTGDAELMDARIGGNGITYTNAGDAIRGQYDELLDYDENIVYPVLNGVKDITITEGPKRGYWVNDVFTPNSNYSCIALPVPVNAKKISYTLLQTAGVAPGNIADKNGTIIQSLDPTAGAHEYNIPDGAYILRLNLFDTSYLTGYTITVEPLAKESVVNDLSDELNDIEYGTYTDIPFAETGSGYILNNQVSYSPGDLGGNNQLMVVNDLSDIGVVPGDVITFSTGWVSGYTHAVAFKDSDFVNGANTYTSAIPYTSTDAVQDLTFKIPEGTTAIAFFNRKPADANPSIKKISQKGILMRLDDIDEEIEDINVKIERRFNTCVEKPYSFSGKNLAFFGDSITYGYISGGSQATNNYPKVFSTHVGATYLNAGVSGSLFTRLDPPYDSTILDAIQNTNLSPYDCIFVAGGVNDWQCGVDAADLANAVDGVCSYLSNNYSGKVIFITPINEAGRTPINTPQQTLQSARNVITQIAMAYGYDVIQGWEFPFPVETDLPAYINIMFQDKIHPTEEGYALYAKALENILC